MSSFPQASVYEKPVRHYMMSERTRLENQYWQYSRDKIACEQLLRGQERLRLHHRASKPYGSHRDADPGGRPRCGPPQDDRGEAGDRRWRRLEPVDADALRGRCRARTPFARLLGNSAALNDDFHITTDRGFTWNQIDEAIARGLGVQAIPAHVPTETLVRFNKEWAGPLLGDKTWSALFDNSKVRRVAGAFEASQDIDEILRRLDRPCERAAESASVAPYRMRIA